MVVNVFLPMNLGKLKNVLSTMLSRKLKTFFFTLQKPLHFTPNLILKVILHLVSYL